MKQPYIVFGVLIGPIIILSVYADIHRGVIRNFGATALLIFMLGLVFYYLRSLKLILTDDRIICKAMLRSREVPIRNIESIDRRRGPFGAGTLWIIRLKSGQGVVRVNRSEEHTSELQSRPHLVCRLLLEKKKTTITTPASIKVY